MSHLGSIRAYPTISGGADIRGAKVYDKNNEKLGKIVDVIFDHDTGNIHYVVVESAGWLHTHEFLIPAERLELMGNDTDPANDRFKVNVDKKHIEGLPAYNANHLSEGRWNEYERSYIDAWSEGPVLHREGSTHAVTPTADEMPIPASSAGLGVHSEPLQPRGTESPLNSSGAADITLTPVTSTFDSRYNAASSGRPVGTHGRGNVREEVESAGEREAVPRKATKEEKLREHLAEEAESTRTVVGDAIYNSADVENLHQKPFAREAPASGDAFSPQEFGLKKRWASFQDHLRTNREAIIARCQARSEDEKKKDVA